MNQRERGFRQPTKEAARRKALRHAVRLVTSERDASAIVAKDHPHRVQAALKKSRIPGYAEAGQACKRSDLRSWRSFRKTILGKKKAAEITVAYLAGPEPSNDLSVLVELGIRPENIWAFEMERGAFSAALDDLRRAGLRGVKMIPISIEEYFTGTPRRFDIIYVDACGPLPSRDQRTVQLIVNLFRHSALAPLGVLITNFARPDISDAEQLSRFTYLIAAYLFPKPFLDAKAGGITDDAGAHGYVFTTDPKAEDSFLSEVRDNFDHYYGSFITRHVMDIAALVAPTIRIANSRLMDVLFSAKFEAAAERGRRFARFAPGFFDDDGPESETESVGVAAKETADQRVSRQSRDPLPTSDSMEAMDEWVDMDGEAIADSSMYSLLWSLAACGCYETDGNFEPRSEDVTKFLEHWVRQLYGTPADKKTAPDVIAAYYAWRSKTCLWSAAMQRLADYSYGKDMPRLCDVPTPELAFYPALAQLAYPAHCNLREARRYQYTAEGKSTPMFLDVLPFDECRYVYDWVSALHLVPDDWSDLSAQLTFRFALDGIAKEYRWYGDDFLVGCHAIGEGGKFQMTELAPRRKIVRT